MVVGHCPGPSLSLAENCIKLPLIKMIKIDRRDHAKEHMQAIYLLCSSTTALPADSGSPSHRLGQTEQTYDWRMPYNRRFSAPERLTYTFSPTSHVPHTTYKHHPPSTYSTPQSVRFINLSLGCEIISGQKTNEAIVKCPTLVISDQ